MRGGRLIVVLLVTAVLLASGWAGVLVLSGGGGVAGAGAVQGADAPDPADGERGADALNELPPGERDHGDEELRPAEVSALTASGDPEREHVDPTHGWRAARERMQDVAWWAGASDADRREVAEVVEARTTGFSFEAVRTYESGNQKQAVAVFKHARSGQEFVLLAGGTFQMGSPTDEVGRVSHETQHEVTISPFLIARTELTQLAWRREFKINPSRWEGERRPVENVKWAQAKSYCDRVGLALPTEAQWEYACRGGEARRWSFGDDGRKLVEHAWYNANSGGRTHAVGKKRANAYGLHDMSGNVWEWCLDRFAVLPFEAQTDPRGPAEGSHWVIKGGSYSDHGVGTRSANRLAWNVLQSNVGFRPVLNLD